MKILFTICGRAGSKGIKNKNIKPFLGKPLPYYTLSAIDLYLKEQTNIEGDIVLNTDSPELIKLMKKNKFRTLYIIERDEALAGDNVSKIDVIKDCLIKMQSKLKKEYDIVIDLDITSPLRTINDVKNLIDTHIKTKCDVTFSVTNARRNPYFNMVTATEHGFQLVNEGNFTTRQQAPDVFDMNASMYAYLPRFLLSANDIFDGYCEAITMYDTAVLDLDHENDFELMEVIAEFLFQKYDSFSQIYNNI